MPSPPRKQGMSCLLQVAGSSSSTRPDMHLILARLVYFHLQMGNVMLCFLKFRWLLQVVDRSPQRHAERPPSARPDDHRYHGRRCCDQRRLAGFLAGHCRLSTGRTRPPELRPLDAERRPGWHRRRDRREHRHFPSRGSPVFSAESTPSPPAVCSPSVPATTPTPRQPATAVPSPHRHRRRSQDRRRPRRRGELRQRDQPGWASSDAGDQVTANGVTVSRGITTNAGVNSQPNDVLAVRLPWASGTNAGGPNVGINVIKDSAAASFGTSDQITRRPSPGRRASDVRRRHRRQREPPWSRA